MRETIHARKNIPLCMNTCDTFPLVFSRALSAKLKELKDKIQTAVVDRVVEDFVDITTPLKQFTAAALAPEGKHCNTWPELLTLKITIQPK